MEERTPDHASDPAFDPNPGFRATPPRTPLGIPNPDAPPSANQMGIAAFITTILGLSCVPFVGSIAGLVLGIVAVRRAPRTRRRTHPRARALHRRVTLLQPAQHLVQLQHLPPRCLRRTQQQRAQPPHKPMSSHFLPPDP